MKYSIDVRIPLSHIRLTFCLSIIAASLACGQTTYYISSNGSDANNGTSTTTPWKTLKKVSSMNYLAGDAILLNRGDVFQGEFSKASGWHNGTSSQPILFGAYGIGPKPLIYGDMTGATWTKTLGRDSMWQAFCGITIDLYGYEKSSGNIWRSIPVRGGETRFYLSNPDSLNVFLNKITTSSFGAGNDTVWMKTWDGNSPIVKLFRTNNLSGTYVTVRDLEFRNFYIGIYASAAQNIIFRNLTFRNTISLTIYLANGCRNSIIDSCTIDSAGYTAIYSGVGGYKNYIRYNTVQYVVDSVLGMPRGAIEMAGIGMQQDTACVAEYNTLDNIMDSGIDSYYNVGDTVRYNIITNTLGGIWLLGLNWVAHDNTVSTSTLGIVSLNTAKLPPELGGGATLRPTMANVYNNSITIASNFGLRGVSNDGTITFDSNRVVNQGNVNTLFTSYESGNIVSTNNSFVGVGTWATGVFPNQVYYTDLSTFKSATGYENGSTWDQTTMGTFSVTPDSLPLNGGVVTLQWTSVNATNASISYKIGNVDTSMSVNTSGSIVINVSATTLFTLTLNGPFGTTTLSARVIVGTSQLDYFLDQNYPNPFNTGTIIGFTLPKDDNVSLKVFDLLGREIATLVEGMQTSGVHQIQWNPKGVASGVYRYRLATGSYSKTFRMVLVR